MNWRLRKNIICILLAIITIILSNLYKSGTINVQNDSEYIPIHCVETEEKKIALTFDINWAEKDNIYCILDTLDKYNVKGTFFIIGSWVEFSNENVEKIKAIYERGHEIGNHSFKHPMFSKLSTDNILTELRKTDEVIEKYTGEKTKLFRFPSGDYNKESYKTVVLAGYIPIQWDVDSIDWKEIGEEIEYRRVISGVKAGSIVLFHNNTKYTPSNLDRILEKLTEENYKCVMVSELIYSENGLIDGNGKQYIKKF